MTAGPVRRVEAAAEAPPRRKLLEIGMVTKVYGPPGTGLRAVDGVSFHLREGEILGLVGESGSGKSTLARIIARLIPQTTGSVVFEDRDISGLSGRHFARTGQRRCIQMVFQDPLASLNPRFTAFRSIADPVRRLGTPAERAALPDLVREAAHRAGLPEQLLASMPHQLSGGQRARVDIARAIVLRPKLLILDEPTSALDASLQAHVIETLLSLRDESEMSYIFVTHDLSLVRLIADRLIVMHRGQLVETGTADEIFRQPQHAYTRHLIAAIPALGETKS
ncbi:ABC transporter ATP-binding protein [Methylobacterium variabile]|uniref:ABC transporter ATP-binding protein n=1 Tax=Methylobacterium variabile TaxID=298794 RepID=UPI00069E7871|nr:ABC transporter ATP-binding protein [Methylobacterium variabile]